MPAIAPPEPVAVVRPLEGGCETYEYAQGLEGRLVRGNRRAVHRAWYDRSEYLTRQEEQPSDDLPAVYQFPIVRTVITTFYDAGHHQPLPFPDSDD
jgi:hypothetical protein